MIRSPSQFAEGDYDRPKAYSDRQPGQRINAENHVYILVYDVERDVKEALKFFAFYQESAAGYGFCQMSDEGDMF